MTGLEILDIPWHRTSLDHCVLSKRWDRFIQLTKCISSSAVINLIRPCGGATFCNSRLPSLIFQLRHGGIDKTLGDSIEEIVLGISNT